MRHSLIFCTYKTYTPDYLGYKIMLFAYISVIYL